MLDGIRARIDADMAEAAAMELRDLLGFLDGYSARFDAEIRRGDVTRQQVRAYADEALARHRESTTEA